MADVLIELNEDLKSQLKHAFELLEFMSNTRDVWQKNYEEALELADFYEEKYKSLLNQEISQEVKPLH